MKYFQILLCLVIVLFPCGKLRAHQVSSVELEFQKKESQWRLLGKMDIAYILPETRAILGGLPMSREAVMKSPSE